MFDKPSIADGVAFALGVLAAIDLNDKPLLATDKIDEIRPDWLLTDEFEAASDRERRKRQSFLSTSVESFRNRLAKRVFATFAPRMRRSPLIPTFSPHAGRRSRER